LVLRRAERAKYMAMRRMARRMGHDFRNVLAAIMSHTEFALTALGENHVAYRNLEDVVLAAREAASRVDNLRGIAGQVERNHAPVDASALVNSMSSLLQAFIPKGITFSINTDDGCRTYVHPQHLRLMLVSLVTNAAEALGDEQGSIEVAVGIDPADPRFVSIRVADDGPGMTPEVRSSAIDPYFTTRQDADGLGLATVYGLVQGYGGQFEISTRLGEGTCVTAKFPRASLPARSTG
jgi:signal transduction histidine kinase